MSTTPHLYVRADSSPSIGAGHAMRTLAVAEEHRRRGGAVTLVAKETLPLVEKAWRALGAELTPDDRDVRDGAWAVVDGYRFDDALERTFVDRGARLVAFDDHKHARHDAASLVVNSAPHAHTLGYATPPVHLLGVSFAQVRAAFVECARARSARSVSSPPPSRRLRCVIIPGASDTRGIGPSAVRAAASAGFDVVVAVGSGGPALDARMRALRESGEGVEVEIVVDADLPSLFAEIDVAIAAAGSTALDACAAGVPTVAVCTADNQRALYAGLVSAGAVLPGGDVSTSTNSEGVMGVDRLHDASVRAELTRRARALVDGRGAARLANAMAHPALVVRRTTSDDARTLFEWTNQPSVRAASFHSEPVAWETHVAWLQKKLASPRALLLVGESASGPVGQVRFDVDEDGSRATIGVSVDETQRARTKGTGTALIRAGVEELLLSTDVRAVDAEIKPDNAASLGAFARAGFAVRTSGERVVMRHERGAPS